VRACLSGPVAFDRQAKCRPIAVRLLFDRLLHPSLAAADLAAGGVDAFARFGWLFDQFNSATVTAGAFDFEFVRQGVSLSRVRPTGPLGGIQPIAATDI